MTAEASGHPCIISVAITGSVPRKKDNPALPVAIAEQIESTHEAYAAGAALVHVHVRDEQENSSSDPERFARLQEGIRAACPTSSSSSRPAAAAALSTSAAACCISAPTWRRSPPAR